MSAVKARTLPSSAVSGGRGSVAGTSLVRNGIVAAARETGIKVPLVVRMKGTNEELGRKILADSGLPIISADNMADAAQKIVAAVK